MQTNTFALSIATSTTTYTANDVVGSLTALTDVIPNAGDGFLIDTAMVIDPNARSDALELWVFTSAVTVAADNAAHSISDADAAKCVGIIPISTYYASALNTVGILRSVGLRIGAGNDIWVLVVTRAASVYATSPLTVLLTLAAD